jgi:hypothetical protein
MRGWSIAAGTPISQPSGGRRRGGGYVVCMTKWEYATVPLLVHATKQILDNWGTDGWELVAVVPGPNPEQLVAYLKRPKEA